LVYTVNKGVSSTILTVSIPASNAASAFSTNTAPAVKGDRITLEVAKPGGGIVASPSEIRASLTFM